MALIRRKTLSISILTQIIAAAGFLGSVDVASANQPGVVIDVSLTPAGDFKAKTEEIKGEAVQQGENVSAESIVVSLKNLKTGVSLRDKHAREKYLEVDKFPEAVLTKATGKGGSGQGKMKIRGIEKDVKGTYKIEGGMLKAEFALKLSEYGITGVKYMGLGVDDEVKLHVIVPVKKATP